MFLQDLQYTVAIERLPYKKLIPIMNGATVGPAHRSDHSCIAQEMEKEI